MPIMAMLITPDSRASEQHLGGLEGLLILNLLHSRNENGVEHRAADAPSGAAHPAWAAAQRTGWQSGGACQTADILGRTSLIE